MSEGSDGRLSELFCALLHFAIIGSYKHTYLLFATSEPVHLVLSSCIFLYYRHRPHHGKLPGAHYGAHRRCTEIQQ